MVNSPEIIKKVQQALSEEDWKILEKKITEAQKDTGKRAQKTLIKDINQLITTTSFKENKPELLLALPDLINNDIDDLFSQIIQQFIKTKDERWLKCVHVLSEKLSKKSYQSTGNCHDGTSPHWCRGL